MCERNEWKKKPKLNKNVYKCVKLISFRWGNPSSPSPQLLTIISRKSPSNVIKTFWKCPVARLCIDDIYNWPSQAHAGANSDSMRFPITWFYILPRFLKHRVKLLFALVSALNNILCLAFAIKHRVNLLFAPASVWNGQS